MLFLITFLYLLQTLLPYTLFRFAITRLKYEEQPQAHKWLGLLPLVFSTGLILLHMPSDLMFTISEEGTVHPCWFSHLYVDAALLSVHPAVCLDKTPGV